ncbi:MAG: cobalamin biosynthesis protein CobD [Lachnospiraceae bacterium]|nr:cobalamin biosynthesis protein CobD [Lachnospiraceae bacterium]
MCCHMTALSAGLALDLLLGDPHCFPHPVKLMGRLIGALTKRYNKDSYNPAKKRRLGGFLVLLVILLFSGATAGLTIFFYRLSIIPGMIFEMIVSYQCIAAKSLYKESMEVSKALCSEDLSKARKRLKMIVGRDTEKLEKDGIIRASVETVAENTSDGVIAPLLFLFIGGPTFGILYKAVNTMDSMIGYKNEKFIDFGRCAAKLDDVFNFIPSRLSAILMIISAYLGGRSFSGKKAYLIWKRDRRNHISPNSAQCESAVAGALSIRLGGPSYYFGKLCEKPFIGDDERPVATSDIGLTNRLMFISELLCYLLCTAVISMIAVSILIFQ